MSYSYDNYRKQWESVTQEHSFTRFPMHLDIESTSHCNLVCPQCWQTDIDKSKHGYMDFDLYKKIIDEGVEKGLCALKLQVRGEALLHSKIIDFIKYAKEKGVLDVHITTNGLLLGKKVKYEALLNSGLDLLVFSLDEHHRKSSKSFKAEENASKFLEYRQKAGKTSPKVRIQTKVYDINEKEAVADSLKNQYPLADIINVGHMWNSQIEINSIDGLSSKYHLKACDYLWQRLTIYWNGDVAICCRDYQNIHFLGNVNDQSVESIWRGDMLNSIREKHTLGKRNELKVCDKCEVCIEKKTQP